MKEVNISFEQTFNDEKITEWQQEKGSFNTTEGVKSLLESVKDNNDFLTEINSKHSATDLNDLIVNKSSSEVITIIKRFEYDNLNVNDKKIKEAKIRKYYGLPATATLTDDQINEFCYKVAIGEIDENSLKNEEGKQGKPPKKNDILKIVGIGSLVLLGIVLFILLIRKRKNPKVVKR